MAGTTKNTMLTIRFSRIGKKKKPFYRLIISEKTKDTWGTYLEQLGHYDPQTKIATLKSDRIQYWIGVGAQTSNSVNNLLIKEGVIKGDKEKSVFISKNRAAKIEKAKPKPVEPKAEEKTEEKPAEAAVEETPVETPAEEAPQA